MKTPSHSSLPKGFTLIELLVVIAIIAVLASAGFAVGPAMMNKAKKLSAQTTAVSLTNAVEQFYSEYSALPDPATNGADAEFSTATSPLLDILVAGNSAASTTQNPRKIRCLDIKEAKNGLDGAVYVGAAIDKILDPWGRPFYIVLDYDYNEQLTVSPTGSNITASTINGRRVVVYSLGVKVPADANSKTLVKTW